MNNTTIGQPFNVIGTVTAAYQSAAKLKGDGNMSHSYDKLTLTLADGRVAFLSIVTDDRPVKKGMPTAAVAEAVVAVVAPVAPKTRKPRATKAATAVVPVAPAAQVAAQDPMAAIAAMLGKLSSRLDDIEAATVARP